MHISETKPKQIDNKPNRNCGVALAIPLVKRQNSIFCEGNTQAVMVAGFRPAKKTSLILWLAQLYDFHMRFDLNSTHTPNKILCISSVA
jgi:hypothetical protein